MNELELARILTEGYELCSAISNYTEGEIAFLLHYQTQLMALLPRSAVAMSAAERMLNEKKGEISNEKFIENISPSKMKFILEGKAAKEIQAFRMAERLNRTVTHLMDSLNVKIPNEIKLLNSKNYGNK